MRLFFALLCARTKQTTDNLSCQLACFVLKQTKVRADIEVTCYTYEGIDAVKSALIAGKAVGDERTPIQIKLIAPPRYVMDTMTLDKDLGKSVLEKAIEVVTEQIIASGGKLEVREEAGGGGGLLLPSSSKQGMCFSSCRRVESRGLPLSLAC